MRKSYVARLSDLSDEALRCHAFGHSWEPGPVERVSPVGMEVWTITLTCTSCTKERIDQVEPGTYELYRRRYSDPAGYRLEEPAWQADYREEWIRRHQH
jgi:hypothetical protein